MRKVINFPAICASFAGKSPTIPIMYFILSAYASYKVTVNFQHPEPFGKSCIFVVALAIFCSFYVISIFSIAFAAAKAGK
jgi:hypothetical protein